MKLEEYLEIENTINNRFFECMHGYIYAVPEYGLYQNKCNVQEECYCVDCKNFVPKVVSTDYQKK